MTWKRGDELEFVSHAVGPTSRNGQWVRGTFELLLSDGGGRVWVRNAAGQRVLSRLTEIRGRTPGLAARIAIKLRGGLEVDDPMLKVGPVEHDPRGAASFMIEDRGRWVTVTVAQS